MAKKPDISAINLLPWDKYMDKEPNQALESIYGHVTTFSKEMRAWYWTSIKNKRRTSFTMRTIAFLMAVFGSMLPIVTGMPIDDLKTKVLLTQGAIVLIAIVGFMVCADRMFGWSSGWIRYITTVMAMENLTRNF